MMTELLTCPVFHRPLSGTLRIVDGALSVKCRACGGVHLISRTELEREWDERQRKTPVECPPHTQPASLVHLPTQPGGNLRVRAGGTNLL